MTAPETVPEPVFDAPWHAHVFALTVHLNEAGQFAWSDWAARFGATLARHGQDRSLNGGADYWAAWLETLESLLRDLGHAETEQVENLRAAWERAYLNTPHGDPVTLDAGR